MTTIISKGNLFSLEKNYVLIHCIGNDAIMGAGIAKQFTQRYKWLKPMTIKAIEGKSFYPRAVYVENNGINIINLVTKSSSYGKPTLFSMELALYDLLTHCRKYNISKIAMPFIGCGLDKLQWDDVYNLINMIFKNTNIEIQIKYI